MSTRHSNKPELEKEKKKLDQQITKTADKVKGKITKGVVKVIWSDRNIKLNELKAELKAIKEVEKMKKHAKNKPTERWTKSEAKGVHATRASLPSHLSCIKNFVNEI